MDSRAIKKEELQKGTVLVISLFFLWSITANLLPILIPHLKEACRLSIFQSSLIDSAYWIAYFVVALPAGMFMRKFGYKNAIICGLLLAATGAFLFYPAAEHRSFSFFLFALFVLASGMTFLETSANPLVTVLGDPQTAVRRLNFAQAFNGFGAFIASMFLSKLIIGNNVRKTADLNSFSPEALDSYYSKLFHALKFPYLMIGFILILVSILFAVTRFPSYRRKDANIHADKGMLRRHPQLLWGITTQFFYVGAQVCVSSFFILYATAITGMSEYKATNYLGLLLLAFMLGRYFGYVVFKYIQAAKLLWFCATICIFLLSVVIFIGSKETLWAFVGVEFFMSIMYPTIFSLAIKGLGDDTPIAASYLVMAIIGGAVFPPLLGYVSDKTGSVQVAYIVPLICFIPVFCFGWKQMRSSNQSSVATP